MSLDIASSVVTPIVNGGSQGASVIYPSNSSASARAQAIPEQSVILAGTIYHRVEAYQIHFTKQPPATVICLNSLNDVR